MSNSIRRRDAGLAMVLVALSVSPSRAQRAASADSACGIAVLRLDRADLDSVPDSVAAQLSAAVIAAIGRDSTVTLVDRSPRYLDSVFAARRRDPRAPGLIPASYLVAGTLERRRHGDYQLTLRAFLTETGEPLASDTVTSKDLAGLLPAVGPATRRLLAAVAVDRARRRARGLRSCMGR